MRKLLVLPVTMLLAMAPAAPALAAGSSGTSNYGQTPTTQVKPATGTSPSKAESKSAPATASSAPAESTKSATLPRTGLDLRWSVGMGLLLVAAGFSIVMVQRRQRRR
jgi:hypothetical protein